ncbi:chemotaxis protein CheW [Lysobacter sp. KIS68-7]|uniref:chemotaxis protein CheW n=1 Tax=Lysobacter sp. KIS68-7 TaxID=2904252 RepID=UPI001E408944|nr:chemotaxis protein CheW [Lysobacter sp. KIS68-7]UHQ19805.1 chemotaxis protein CheW [Lysobacter sp. KIS68-7]
MTQTPSHDIRGVLIQVTGGRLLLPNATIAEVMSFADPEPVANTPDWLLGRIRWRGWQLPLIAFSRLSGIADEKGGLGSKVVVLKSLSADAKTPYFALLTQGFPRLVTVSQDTVVADGGDDDETLPAGVQARVLLNEDNALLPDLERVEAMIGEALRQAA